MKLTATQRAILERAAGGDVLFYMPYMGNVQPSAYFFWQTGSGQRKPRIDSVMKLIDAGLLEWFGRDSFGQPDQVRISAKGKRRHDAETDLG